MKVIAFIAFVSCIVICSCSSKPPEVLTVRDFTQTMANQNLTSLFDSAIVKTSNEIPDVEQSLQRFFRDHTYKGIVGMHKKCQTEVEVYANVEKNGKTYYSTIEYVYLEDQGWFLQSVAVHYNEDKVWLRLFIKI